ncbi:MAG: heavy-metal-associated domain-containing protein [Clostridiales bacterium]|jgi:Cu+-exporting ATPase|nr:cation transporter [Eubacteriales bacterium]MDH7565845.1 heavy-metal-associated domain-containing protein [Clostridiales bacterium]
MEGCQGPKSEKEFKSAKFNVEGLTCGSCSAELEKQLLGLNGVVDVDINLDSKQIFVDFESNKTRYEDIRKTIQQSGYNVL